MSERIDIHSEKDYEELKILHEQYEYVFNFNEEVDKIWMYSEAYKEFEKREYEKHKNYISPHEEFLARKEWRHSPEYTESTKEITRIFNEQASKNRKIWEQSDLCKACARRKSAKRRNLCSI